MLFVLSPFYIHNNSTTVRLLCMGELENKNKKLVRRTRIQEAILTYLISGGRCGGNLLAREVVSRLIEEDLSPQPRMDEVVGTAASRLKKKGLLKFEDGHYSITATGKEILERWRHADFKINRPKKWDRKWRIIIFDIPEKKREIRDEVRIILTNAGFQRLQDSVWVFPYDCEDVIGLLKMDYGIGREMLYVIADQIENDKYLRMDFDLIPYG